MARYVINGKFMGEPMQGIVRYAREIITALDLQCKDCDFILLLPPGTTDNIGLKNIRCITYGKHTGIKWEQLDLAKYLRKHKDCICVNFCNVAPFAAQAGVTVVHDIMYKVLAENYTTLRNRVSRWWHVFQYYHVINREKLVITVSEFSKKDIEKYYPKAKGKTVIIPNAWQHVTGYSEALDWNERYPFLKKGEFYFSLSSLARHKNGKWIVETAKNNPDAVFAVAGKYYETEKYAIPSNVHMLGFVSDDDACALIKHCKAFIHPALYEGFGIPPLEALALGAEVISSDRTSLPEVLGNSVHYINPDKYNVDLDRLLAEPIADRQEVLNRYSWEKSAKLLLDALALVN